MKNRLVSLELAFFSFTNIDDPFGNYSDKNREFGVDCVMLQRASRRN